MLVGVCYLEIGKIQDDMRPLTDDEVKVIATNRCTLVELIHFNRIQDRLLADGCVTSQQMELIKEPKGDRKRFGELLDTIRRRSFNSMVIFIECLKETHHDHIAQVLEEGGGQYEVFKNIVKFTTYTTFKAVNRKSEMPINVVE